MEFITDFTFEFDLILNFLCAHYKSDGNLEKSFKKNCAKYLKTWFLFDLSTCMPITLIEYIASDGGRNSYNGMLKIMRLPRLYKLFRATRIAKILKYNKNNQTLEKVQDFL